MTVEKMNLVEGADYSEFAGKPVVDFLKTLDKNDRVFIQCKNPTLFGVHGFSGMNQQVTWDYIDKKVTNIEKDEKWGYHIYTEDLEPNTAKSMSFDTFLDFCEARGGNWVSMILSGIKNAFPEYYNNLPDDKTYTWQDVVTMLNELGVYSDTGMKENLSKNDLNESKVVDISDYEEVDPINRGEIIFGKRPIKDDMNEDTVKLANGKWANKGDEGIHGTFDTKKEADAQRKAMFANGFKEGMEEGIEDFELLTADQEFDSAKTSINSSKLPAIFHKVNFKPGTLNLDYGGGRFDNATEFLASKDVTNLIYDKYNRSANHNNAVIDAVKSNGGADTCTLSNVLNVIKEPNERKNVLTNIKNLLKPNGILYITVYEGTGRNDERPTSAGYQLNKKTADYMDEVSEVFSNVKIKNKVIIASDSALHEDMDFRSYDDVVSNLIGNMSDSQLDKELSLFLKISKELKLKRPDKLIIYVDGEFDNDPSWFAKPEKDIDFNVKKYVINDVPVIVEETDTSLWLYFKTRDDAQKYFDFLKSR